MPYAISYAQFALDPVARLHKNKLCLILQKAHFDYRGSLWGVHQDTASGSWFATFSFAFAMQTGLQRCCFECQFRQQAGYEFSVGFFKTTTTTQQQQKWKCWCKTVHQKNPCPFSYFLMFLYPNLTQNRKKRENNNIWKGLSISLNLFSTDASVPVLNHILELGVHVCSHYYISMYHKLDTEGQVFFISTLPNCQVPCLFIAFILHFYF